MVGVGSVRLQLRSEHMTQSPRGRIITPDSENEAIILEGVDVYAHSHPVGDKADLHTHDVNHILVMRSGRMRWTVDGETIDSQAGDVIVAPAGVEHGFEVLGDEEVKLMCIEAPNVSVEAD